MVTMPVLLRGCPKRATKPSPLLAAISLAIAAAHDRRWIAGPVSSLIPQDLSPARLSHLKARILPVLEAEVASATRRGRPPLSVADHVSSTAALEALLEVAASVISQVPIRGRVLQDRLVEAAERLRREHRIPLKTFASKLRLSARTLRYWRQRRRPAPKTPGDLPEETPSAEDEPAEATAGEPPTGAEPPVFSNGGRFSLDLQPPGLQAMADTTDIRVFGTTLKLVGAQDTGNRHRRLLESFRVSEAESAQLIIDVVSAAFAEPAGTQLIVDQGTPYVAEETKKALEKLEVEHCPQKEATPTEKAPLERTWRTLKEALEPLLGLTDRLAERIPALHNTALARAAAELLVGTFLRVYASARAPLPHPLDARDPLALVSVVEDAKERARAEHRSRKLLLQDIHARYAMAGSAAAFVRAHRRAALEDIQEAERRLRDRACRCRTRACDRYFAGILSKVSEEGQRRRAVERRHAHETRRLSADSAGSRSTNELSRPTPRSVSSKASPCSPASGEKVGSFSAARASVAPSSSVPSRPSSTVAPSSGRTRSALPGIAGSPPPAASPPRHCPRSTRFSSRRSRTSSGAPHPPCPTPPSKLSSSSRPEPEPGPLPCLHTCGFKRQDVEIYYR
jgi:hypothetical protein